MLPYMRLRGTRQNKKDDATKQLYYPAQTNIQVLLITKTFALFLELYAWLWNDPPFFRWWIRKKISSHIRVNTENTQLPKFSQIPTHLRIWITLLKNHTLPLLKHYINSFLHFAKTLFLWHVLFSFTCIQIKFMRNTAGCTHLSYESNLDIMTELNTQPIMEFKENKS
jgi:hypothetical protein